MGDASFKPELGQRGGAVAAANDARSGACGDGLGDGARAGRERLDLEGAHRPVPEDAAGGRDQLAVGGRTLRPDVEPHPTLGHVDPVELADLGLGAELFSDHQVGRQQQLRAALCGFRQHAAGWLDVVIGAERVTDLVALRGEEGKTHRAADQNCVGALEEGV